MFFYLMDLIPDVIILKIPYLTNNCRKIWSKRSLSFTSLIFITLIFFLEYWFRTQKTFGFLIWAIIFHKM